MGALEYILWMGTPGTHKLDLKLPPLKKKRSFLYDYHSNLLHNHSAIEPLKVLEGRGHNPPFPKKSSESQVKSLHFPQPALR